MTVSKSSSLSTKAKSPSSALLGKPKRGSILDCLESEMGRIEGKMKGLEEAKTLHSNTFKDDVTDVEEKYSSDEYESEFEPEQEIIRDIDAAPVVVSKGDSRGHKSTKEAKAKSKCVPEKRISFDAKQRPKTAGGKPGSALRQRVAHGSNNRPISGKNVQKQTSKRSLLTSNLVRNSAKTSNGRSFSNSSDIKLKANGLNKLKANDPNKQKHGIVSNVGNNSTSSLSKLPQQSLCANEETIQLASNLSTAEIKSLMKSKIIQQAMAQLGFNQEDIISDRLLKRFAMEITPSIAQHLERRRVEALAAILGERERLVNLKSSEKAEPRKQNKSSTSPEPGMRSADVQIRPKTAGPRIVSKREALRNPSQMVENAIGAIVQKQSKFTDKMLRLQEWERKRDAQAQTKREQIERKLQMKVDLAQRRKEEKQQAIRTKLQKKMQANAAAKSVQRALISKRKASWQEKAQAIEARRASEIEFLNSTVLVESANAKEAHRKKIREEAKKRREEQFQAMQLAQEQKTKLAAQSRARLEMRAAHEKEKRKLSEVDRILKLERLYRQDLHNKMVAQGRLEKKWAVGKAMDQVADQMRTRKSQAERERILKKREVEKKKPFVGTPGPGEYEIGSSLSSHGFSLGNADPKQNEERRLEHLRSCPGPGEYNADVDSSSTPHHMQKGVSFSKGHVLGELDWAIKRASAVPGPYPITNVVGTDTPAFKIGKLACEDLERVRAKIAGTTPGPAHYQPKDI